MANTSNNLAVLNKFVELYEDLFKHDGYGEIRLEMKTQRAGQKEVILHCGKQHRYVVDFRGVGRSASNFLIVPNKKGKKDQRYYLDGERRKKDRRVAENISTSFKLERRTGKERRSRRV